MANRFSSDTKSAIPVHAIEAGGEYPANITPAQRDWLKATGFSGGLGEVALLPDGGDIGAVLVG